MSIPALAPAAVWLASTPLSLAARHGLRATPWLAPADETVHILSIAVVVCAMGVFNLRLLGVAGRDQSARAIAHRFLPLGWTALGVLLATGSLLVLNRPQRYFRSDPFTLKMTLILLAALCTGALSLPLRRDPDFWDHASRRPFVRLGAVVALLLWAGVIACGRWIAYG
jgi:hypothetical protein